MEPVVDAIITIVVAGITGYISAKVAYNREIEKRIYQMREETYVSLFKEIERLKRNPYLVFNSTDFLVPFRELKAQLNLYASQEVLDILVPLNEEICDISNNYFDSFTSQDAYELRDARLEYGDVTEAELQQKEEDYMREHIIDEAYIDSVFKRLIAQIRKELKTT